MYIPLGLLSLIITIVIAIVAIKQEDRKAEKRFAEQSYEENLKKERYKNYLEQEKIKEDFEKKEIMQLLECSFNEAERARRALSDFTLIIDFQEAETITKKRNIIDQALKYQTYYDDILLPIIRDKNLSVTINDFESSKEYFFEDMYSDISIEQKLYMLDFNNTNKFRKNHKVLLDALKDVYENPYEKFNGQDWHYLALEDYVAIVRCFNNRFSLDIDSSDMIDIFDPQMFQWDSYALAAIFSDCIFFSPWRKKNMISSQHRIFYNCMHDLFFSAIYYDILKYQELLSKKYDPYLKYIENTYYQQ